MVKVTKITKDATAAQAGLSDIFTSIDALANRGKISRQRSFAAWFAINFYDLDEDEALESASADGGNDQGIDIAFYDDSNDEIVVLQAHCPDNVEKVTPKTNGMPWLVQFLTLSIRKNSKPTGAPT